MSHVIPINKDIYWIGVNDRETHLFEALWPLPKGVSYNSYLILDEKVAVVDSVKAAFAFDYLHKIKSLLKEGQKVDYLIINHMEPDHSGAIELIRNAFPEVQIVCNKKTTDFLRGFYGITENLKIIEDGETIDLGKHKLKFYLTPMVHWPETMMTYDTKDKILFSGDAFGGFGVLEGGIFDDEIKIEFYQEEIRRYFTNIVAKYSVMVKRAIKKLEGVDIQTVAATHGPIWRTNPQKIIQDYNCWSNCETEKGVVIAYGSMYGHTEKMVEIIARTLAEEGIENIRIYHVSKTHLSYIVNDIWRYKALILGSCTYNAGLFPPMAQLVSFLQQSKPKNHLLGIFGTYSWSGGAVRELTKFGEKGTYNLIRPIVEVKHSPSEEDLKQCEMLAKHLAEELNK